MNRRVGDSGWRARLKAIPSGVLGRLRGLGQGVGAKLRLRLPFGARNRRQVRSAPQAHRVEAPVTPVSLRARLPIALAWLAPLAAMALAFAVPIIGARSYEYVMESGYFHVRNVVLDQTTTRARLYPELPPPSPHFSKNEILEIAGIGAGTHLLDADIDAMAVKLEADPWIRWARVERELPDTLIVHVIEHVPMAFIAPKVELSGDVGVDAIPGLALVDELGEVFAPAPFDKVLDLPVITGLALSRLENAGERAAIQKELAAGLNVLRIWASQKLSRRYPVSELRLLAGGAYALVLDGRAVGAPTEVVLGRGPFREKLMRLEFVLEHLQASGKLAEYVLLDLADEEDAHAIDMAGARVVVKAKLGIDVTEAIETSVEPTPAAKPRGSAATRGGDEPAREAPPDDDLPVPAVNARSPRQSNDSPTGTAPVPGAPAGNDPHANETDPEAPGEGAPLTGGRPADDLGEE
jgi:hypothetical protein